MSCSFGEIKMFTVENNRKLLVEKNYFAKYRLSLNNGESLGKISTPIQYVNGKPQRTEYKNITVIDSKGEIASYPLDTGLPCEMVTLELLLRNNHKKILKISFAHLEELIHFSFENNYNENHLLHERMMEKAHIINVYSFLKSFTKFDDLISYIITHESSSFCYYLARNYMAMDIQNMTLDSYDPTKDEFQNALLNL